MNISGGLNVSQIYSVEAESKAFRMYSYIKNNLKMDVYNIAINTGYSVEQIRILKDYLFINSHQLISGYEPFHPNYEIGQSWLRLCGHTKNMNIQPHDLLLISMNCMRYHYYYYMIKGLHKYRHTNKQRLYLTILWLVESFIRV